MRIAAAVLALAAGGAAAADTPRAQGPRMFAAAGDATCVAYVRVHNVAGTYNAAETVETARGPVSIRYRTVGGHRPGDDDEIAVEALPFGLHADPMTASIPDGATLRVCLFEWTGG